MTLYLAQRTLQPSQEETVDLRQLLPPNVSTSMMPTLGVLGLLISALIFIAYWDNRSRKGTLATAKFGSTPERSNARAIAAKQIKERAIDKVALYIGKPAEAKRVQTSQGFVNHIPLDPKTLYVPYANEGIAVIGRPGSGKTFSAIDPLVRSAIDQGFPVIYYDFKGHESPPPSGKMAAYAALNGYQVSVLDPSFPGTCVCNPLDFLHGVNDAENAAQLADVLNQNFRLSGGSQASSNGDFFSQTGNQLVQAILMLAKSSEKHPDIALCHKILSLPSLLNRLQNANLEQYLKVAFDNFLSSAGAPETAAGVATTGSIMFSKFMTPKVLAAFTGKTTLPLDLEGRHFVVFRMDPLKRAVFGPLLAATLHMLVTRNIYRPRQTPLVVSLDELPSLYLPMLADWLNQNRSSGFVGIAGFQALGLLEGTFGENKVNGIMSGSTTQFVFQLNDKKTTDYFSSQLGQEEVKYRQNSRSSGRGGASSSTSENQQTKPLVEVHELQQFPKGTCCLLNSGNGNSQAIRLPLKLKVNIPARDIKAMAESKQVWPKVEEKLIHMGSAREPPSHELEDREVEAEDMLPLPDENDDDEFFNFSF